MSERQLQLACKINWSLRVLGRRADGFHELRSWFLALAGGDVLRWEPGPTGLTVHGDAAAGVPADASNLVLQADEQWRAAGGVAPTFHWTLEKQLPPGSGLGAGSADAAGVLTALQREASAPLTAAQCQELALALGSDVPFFAAGYEAVLLGGRGERRLAEAQAPEGEVVLAIPALSAPTPAVFKALQAPLWDEEEPADREAHAWPAQPAGNDLEAAALHAVPALREVRAQLHSLAPFQLSGSGSAWFHPCASGSGEAAALAADVRALGFEARVLRMGLPQANSESSA